VQLACLEIPLTQRAGQFTYSCEKHVAEECISCRMRNRWMRAPYRKRGADGNARGNYGFFPDEISAVLKLRLFVGFGDRGLPEAQ
jgi:hypothetical protein